MKVLSVFQKELKSVEQKSKPEAQAKSQAKSKAKSQSSAPISSPGTFTCPKCSKTFKTQKGVDTHVRTCKAVVKAAEAVEQECNKNPIAIESSRGGDCRGAN